MSKLDEKLIFFDIEVLSDYFSITFLKGDDIKTFNTIDNTLSQIRAMLVKIVESYILCGYNNKAYDDHFIEVILKNPNISLRELIALNRSIIEDDSKRFIDAKYWDFSTLDLMNELDSSKSLKQFMGYYKDTTTGYKWDFEQYSSIAIIKKNGLLEDWKHYELFDVEFLKFLWFNHKRQGLTRAEYYNYILGQFPENRLFSIKDLVYLEMLFNRTYIKIHNPVMKDLNHITYEIKRDITKSMDYLKEAYPNYVFEGEDKMEGGLHISIIKYISNGVCTSIDIKSMYPTIMSMDELYQGILNQSKILELMTNRLKLKKEKNPANVALKILINSIYGKLGYLGDDKHYYTQLRILVPLIGKMYILQKAVELHKQGIVLLSINTDGILMEGHHFEGELTQGYFEYEVEHFDKVWMRDISNYGYMKDGKYSGKGALCPISVDDPTSVMLTGGNNPFYSNTLLGKIMELDIPEVPYLIDKEGIKTQRFYPSEEGKINGRMLSDVDHGNIDFIAFSKRTEWFGLKDLKLKPFADFIATRKLAMNYNEFYNDKDERGLLALYNGGDITIKSPYFIEVIANNQYLVYSFIYKKPTNTKLFINNIKEYHGGDEVEVKLGQCEPKTTIILPWPEELCDGLVAKR